MSSSHNYLEAAQAGDLSAVKFYLGPHPEEVDINYQDAKLCSALHRAVQSTRNSHEVVQFLIENGIDCGLRNEQNQTAAEMARRLGRGDLMILLLEWEFRGVPLREIFYQLLRRNSMELVCVYIVNWKLPVAEAIRLTEEAYQALRLKGVKLEDQTQYELLQELVKHYGANPTTCQRQDISIGKKELLEYIDFVLQNTDEDNLNEISDEVLMAMREIVKQMYLGKERYDEALMEVQHCLCAFVAVCDGLVGMEDCTLIINKQLVLKFLRFVAKQLRQESSKLSSRDRKVRKLLRKTFVLLKEWNSVMKIVYYLTEACKIDLKQLEDRIAKQLFMDRCVQVVGEAVKSTKLSPNLSRRMQVAFEFMVSGGTASCYKSVREFHSHGYPVTKYLLEMENDFSSYVKLQENFKTMLSFFECMRSTLMIVVQKRFLSSLYRLRTVKQVRSLAMFADEQVIGSFGDPAAHQETFYSEALSLKCVDNLKILLKDDSENYNTLAQLEQRLKSHFAETSKLRFNHLQMGQCFGTLLQAARACQNIADFRSLLKFALIQSNLKYSIEFYSQQRQQISRIAQTFMYPLLERYGDRMDQQVINTAFQLFSLLDCQSASGLDRVQLKRTNHASDGYVEKILRESGAYDYYKEVPSNMRKKLRKSVEKNVFDVESCFKVLSLPDSPKLRAFRKKQEDEFQAAFDRKVTILKGLIVNNAQPTGKIFEYQMTEYSIATIAMQSALLEIVEILLGVGAIKLNLHQLDQRVPFVTGKNLRDGLAHDMTMYDVIGESRAQYVCNAIYYGTLCVKLYDKKDWPEPAPFKKDGSITLHDKLQWYELQQKLYDQLKDIEGFDFERAEIDKPDILGCRRETTSDFKMYHNNALLQALRHNTKAFVDHIDGSSYSKKVQRLINEIGHPMIPRKSSNQMSLPEKAETLLNLTLAVGDFRSYQTITQKYNACFTYQAAHKRNPAVLDRLEELNPAPSTQMLLDSIASGNVTAFQWLLQKLDQETIRLCCPLQNALANGQLEMAQLLVPLVVPDEKDAEIAIIHKFNKILPKIIPHVTNFSSLFISAVTRDNLEAVKMLESESNHPPDYKHLLHYVAAYNRTVILRYFLQNDDCRKSFNDLNEYGQTPLDVFARRGNLAAVKMISQYTNDIASAVKSAVNKNRNRVVKFLLRSNQHLLSDMLHDFISIAIERKNNTLLQYLLKSRTKSGDDLQDLSKQFLRAIHHYNFNALEILLKHDPQAAQTTELRTSYNSYHFAVQALSTCSKADLKLNLEHIFHLLENHHSDLCYKDKTGMTPLNRAVSFRNLDLVRRLYQLGPSAINEPDGIGRTPLISALTVRNLPIVQYLVENGADLKDLSTFRYPIIDNKPPITHFLDIECLEYAVKSLHLDVDLKDSCGRTLLHELCRTDNAAFVEFVVEQCHAKAHSRDHAGETVLHHAIRNDSKAVLDYLLKQDDRVDYLEQINDQGQTALMLAISTSGRMPMAYKLVMAGASKERLLQMIGGSCKEALEYLKK